MRFLNQFTTRNRLFPLRSVILGGCLWLGSRNILCWFMNIFNCLFLFAGRVGKRSDVDSYSCWCGLRFQEVSCFCHDQPCSTCIMLLLLLDWCMLECYFKYTILLIKGIALYYIWIFIFIWTFMESEYLWFLVPQILSWCGGRNPFSLCPDDMHLKLFSLRV